MCFCIRCTLIRLSDARTRGEWHGIVAADQDHQSALYLAAVGEAVAHNVVTGERV